MLSRGQKILQIYRDDVLSRIFFLKSNAFFKKKYLHMLHYLVKILVFTKTYLVHCRLQCSLKIMKSLD